MKKVVSATLAGALAVGMVPAMALADDAVELQADIEDDVALGSITAANDEDGNALSLGGTLKFTLSDDAKDPLYVVPTEITTYTGKVIDLTKDAVKADYKVAYYKVSKSGAYNKQETATDIFPFAGADRFDIELSSSEVAADAAKTHNWTAGDYYVAVWHKDLGSNQAIAIKFTIEADTLAGAYLYEYNALAADKGASDKVFNYTGADLKSSLKLTFGESGDIADGDYKLDYFVKQGSKYVTATDVTDAGEYAVKVTGLNEYAGYVSDPIYFTVGALNLAEATLTFNAGVEYAVAKSGETAGSIGIADVAKLNGGTVPGGIVLTYDGAFDTDVLTPKAYTYTLSAPKIQNLEGTFVDNPNFAGTQQVTIVRYEKAAEIKYDGVKGTSFTVAAGEKFDADEISVTNGNAANPQKVPYTVTYLEEVKAGVWKEAVDITAPGTYKAVVAVNDSSYLYGGKAEIAFTVAHTQLGSGNVFVTYNGALNGVPAGGVPYTGADVLDSIGVTVVDKTGKELVKGTDYVIEVKNNATSKVVDEVVNVGSYTLTVKPAVGSKYKFDAVTQTVKVNATSVTAKVLDQVLDGKAGSIVIYTGDEIDPIVNFTVGFDINGDKAIDAKDVIAVPDSAYSIVIKSYEDKNKKKATASTMPKAIEAAGTYTFQIAAAKDNVNFVFDTTTTYTMVVTDKNVFPDVPAGKWFADEVYKIATYQVDPDGNKNAYSPVTVMGGYDNGLFGPYDNMKRGDMALVLARAAGIAKPKDTAADGTMGGVLDSTVDVPFVDVKGNEYYAWAIKAMSEAGIMGGYTDGSGEFGAQDTLTREQVATVLYRYEGVYGDNASLLASAIDGYKDAAEVSKYAVPAMNWAVETGLFGVDTDYLNPGENITRAELAAVLVRYLGL